MLVLHIALGAVTFVLCFALRTVDGFVPSPIAPATHSSMFRGHTETTCTRSWLHMVNCSESPEVDSPELELVGLVVGGEDADRFGSLAADLMAKHGRKVASSSSVGSASPSGCLPSFCLMREGLVVDRYCGECQVEFREELLKRVDAVLSLSCQEDKSSLKALWAPPSGGLYEEEMAVATYAVQLASTVARELQKKLKEGGAISKSDSSPVTVADFSVQAIVLSILERYFPDHGFIAEESSQLLRQDPHALAGVLDVVRKALLSPLMTEDQVCAAVDLGGRGHGKKEKGGRTWVLDPIDGTKGFLRQDQFCVALGLLDSEKAVAGILGCPNLPASGEQVGMGGGGMEVGALAPDGKVEHQDQVGNSMGRGQIFVATKGEGAFMRSLAHGGEEMTRVVVDTALRARDSAVLESVEASHSSHGVAGQVCRDLGITRPPVRVDSQCKYGLLAMGQGGIYLRLPRWGYVENIWDHVAGAVVIQEAGGRVTDSNGVALDFSQGAKLPKEVVGVVATSGKIHKEVVDAVHSRQVQDWASGWYRLVVVLFHGRWTQESQHAVGIVRQLANQRAGITHPSLQGLSPEQGGIGTEVDDEVLLFEADVMSLIDVAERHTLTSLPSLHAFLGGREVLRRQVKEDDTPASLGKMIAGLTQRCTVKLGA